jgi:transposase
VAYLKEENRILRARLPDRIVATPQEKKRLLRAGRRLGVQLKELMSFVSYQTFRRWIREAEENQTKSKPASNRKPGRPRTPEEVRDLIIQMRKDTGFRYTKLMGELRKLGIKLSRQTVKNILKEAGLEPLPNDSKDSWDAFLARHAERFHLQADVDGQGTRELVHAGVSTPGHTAVGGIGRQTVSAHPMTSVIVGRYGRVVTAFQKPSYPAVQPDIRSRGKQVAAQPGQHGHSAPGGTIFVIRRPRRLDFAACFEARYRSAAICSESLCCSMLPESPVALAGPSALSRIVWSRSSAIGVSQTAATRCLSGELPG